MKISTKKKKFFFYSEMFQKSLTHLTHVVYVTSEISDWTYSLISTLNDSLKCFLCQFYLLSFFVTNLLRGSHRKSYYRYDIGNVRKLDCNYCINNVVFSSVRTNDGTS